MKYRKKPIIIDAIKFTGDGMEILEWASDFENGATSYPYICSQNGLMIHTLEGDMKVSDDDYVVCGIEKEFYSCKPRIFEASYEEIR